MKRISIGACDCDGSLRHRCNSVEQLGADNEDSPIYGVNPPLTQT
jgi:hypothetical protein